VPLIVYTFKLLLSQNDKISERKKQNIIIITIALGMWRVWVRRRGCIGSWWGNRREGDHWGDLGVDGWIILGRISRWWDVGIWTGLGWPRIEIGGGLL